MSPQLLNSPGSLLAIIVGVPFFHIFQIHDFSTIIDIKLTKKTLYKENALFMLQLLVII